MANIVAERLSKTSWAVGRVAITELAGGGRPVSAAVAPRKMASRSIGAAYAHVVHACAATPCSCNSNAMDHPPVGRFTNSRPLVAQKDVIHEELYVIVLKRHVGT